jgi:hypothetical protein
MLDSTSHPQKLQDPPENAVQVSYPTTDDSKAELKQVAVAAQKAAKLTKEERATNTERASASCTVVTAYFEGLVQHEAMFSLNDAMLIFTEPSLLSKVTSMRAHAANRTHIVQLELNQTTMAKRYSSLFWAHQYAIDPTKPAALTVYWFRNERANWLKSAADLNPFKSNFFVFLGIDSAPNFSEGATLVRAIDQLAQKLHDRVLVIDPSIDSVMPPSELIAGSYAAITKWNDTYYTLLEQRVADNDINLTNVDFEFTASGTMGILFDEKNHTLVKESKGQAFALGLQAGDIVVFVNGVPVDVTEKPKNFRSKLANRPCTLTVQRFPNTERFSEDGGEL